MHPWDQKSSDKLPYNRRKTPVKFFILTFGYFQPYSFEHRIQSIKIYIAPLQDPYSEALPTRAKRKTTVLRRWLTLRTGTIWEVP